MEEVRGDEFESPLIFNGLQPGALPSALDFNTFADANSWRTRSDTAQILRPSVQAGLYYIGVYNNDDDIQEAANYSVTVQWSRSAPLCPWNCNNNGNCTSDGTCKCISGGGLALCTPNFCYQKHPLFSQTSRPPSLTSPSQARRVSPVSRCTESSRGGRGVFRGFGWQVIGGSGI
jgi:hypothetical protein